MKQHDRGVAAVEYATLIAAIGIIVVACLALGFGGSLRQSTSRLCHELLGVGGSCAGGGGGVDVNPSYVEPLPSPIPCPSSDETPNQTPSPTPTPTDCMTRAASQ